MFVLMHLPGKITYKEIDEMINTVDKNQDGKISYSEFRVRSLDIDHCKIHYSPSLHYGILSNTLMSNTKCLFETKHIAFF